jgi:outer membrane protein
MKIKLKLLTVAASAAAYLYTLPAAADEEVWWNTFRAGSYTVFNHSKAQDLQGPYVPAGVNFDAKDIETLYIGYSRRLSSDFELELALGYPPLSKVEGKGPATVGSVPYNGQTVSSARWISPTLLLEYKFLPESSKWRPYIGAGVNYTQFYDRTVTAQGAAATGGPTQLSLRASVGPAGTVGVAYNVSGHWHMYASYSISRINSDLTLNTAGVQRTSTIKFGPQALVISGGYSF